MEKVFIYYSNTGNGDIVANKLSSYNIAIKKICSNYKLSSNLFIAMLTGGFKAIFNRNVKIKDFDFNISEYDEVIIGSPIWADRLSAPINSLLKKLDLSDKKVSLILYSGGEEIIRAIDQVKFFCPNASIITLHEPKKNDSELEKLGVFYE